MSSSGERMLADKQRRDFKPKNVYKL